MQSENIPARIPFNEYIREKRFNSKLRRNVSDFFYDAVRYWGDFKKDILGFDAVVSKHRLLDAELTPELLCQICGFEIMVAERILSSVSSDTLKYFFERAPMTVRVNGMQVTRDALVAHLKSDYELVETAHSPFGIQFADHVNVRQLPLFKDGTFEIQDEGSQLISLMTPITPGQRLLDYCAGTGGKSLAIYDRLFGSAEIDAYDISKSRLKQLSVRASKLKYTIKTVSSPETSAYDTVLVDAPCSGTGSIRRDPDLHLRLTPKSIEDLIQTQRDVVRKAVECVKPGGYLFYVTCSLLKEENEQQAEYFNKQYAELSPVPISELIDPQMLDRLHLSNYFKTGPWLNGMDGFFGAVFKKQ